MKKYKLHKGILVAIEGIDGTGKTTQTIKLRDYFIQKGVPTVSFKEPTDGKFGQEIKRLSKYGRDTVTPQEEFEIFLQDRIEDCNNNITPSLEHKKLVLMDRYYFSNIAYQSVLGLSSDYIEQRNKEIAPPPDLVIILDVAAKISLSRILHFRKEQHNHFEREDYLDKVREAFRGMKHSYIQIVDGSPDEDTVFSHLKNIVNDLIVPFAVEDVSQIDLFAKGWPTEDTVYHNN